jgi:FMN-dependent NADH-azoreductase
MKRLLHIIATPRGEQSRTLQVSDAFLDSFKETHPNWVIDELNLTKEKLPDLSLKSVSGKYILLEGKDLFGRSKELWAEIIQHIDRFKTADLFLISTPMWNFHIPYMLKHYIDLLVQPRYTFRYTESGATEGLVQGRKMVVITSRGGQYEGKTQSLDFQEPYLRTIFGFIGITDVKFVKAEPMDMGIEKQKEQIKLAQNKAVELAKGIVD